MTFYTTDKTTTAHKQGFTWAGFNLMPLLTKWAWEHPKIQAFYTTINILLPQTKYLHQYFIWCKNGGIDLKRANSCAIHELY